MLVYEKSVGQSFIREEALVKPCTKKQVPHTRYDNVPETARDAKTSDECVANPRALKFTRFLPKDKSETLSSKYVRQLPDSDKGRNYLETMQHNKKQKFFRFL